jgi:hypothetical protein
MDFQEMRTPRRYGVTKTGRLRGGQLVPVAIEALRSNEGGMISQSITMELDPIMGRVITPITAELIAVFVPVQAMDVLKNPTTQYAGVTDVVRQKLLTGNPLFVTEAENELSRRMGVIGRSVSGVRRVSETIRLGHNCAVNHLRERLYWRASQLLAANVAVTPALLSSTVLDRFNAVLDPDDRINGSVQLSLPTIQLPVTGVSKVGGKTSFLNPVLTTASHADYFAIGVRESTMPDGGPGGSNSMGMKVDNSVFATLNGQTAGNVTLDDFYNAEKVDKLVRIMDQMVKDNPQYGQEMCVRWAHGLSVDPGPQPFVIAQRVATFGRDIVGAMDTAGVTAETVRSDFMVQLGFSVPVPRTELGGVIVTFAVLKPDETLARQPHPELSVDWVQDNYVAQELMLDPQPVRMRELDSNIASASENTIAFYTGFNEMKRNYVNYGLNGWVTPSTLTNKVVMWQLEVPLSVTPDSILYPATLSHAPFVDTAAEVCIYTVASNVNLRSPLKVGPTPIETLSIIDSATLLT